MNFFLNNKKVLQQQTNIMNYCDLRRIENYLFA